MSFYIYSKPSLLSTWTELPPQGLYLKVVPHKYMTFLFYFKGFLPFLICFSVSRRWYLVCPGHRTGWPQTCSGIWVQWWAVWCDMGRKQREHPCGSWWGRVHTNLGCAATQGRDGLTLSQQFMCAVHCHNLVNHSSSSSCQGLGSVRVLEVLQWFVFKRWSWSMSWVLLK